MPDEDAIIVERMRAAGALIIGKTNVPEYGYGSNSYNPLFGLTRNARRCDRHYRRLERAVLKSYIGETAREIFRMARVFVTGSADGLGKMAAELLIEQGHNVVLHARSAARADEIRKKIAGAEDIVVGDLGEHRGDEVRRRPGQQARPFRCRHPQRRNRLPRAEAA